MEHEIGSIRAGKKADFTVLEADPFETPPGDLKDIPVWGTVFEGEPAPPGIGETPAPNSRSIPVCVTYTFSA